MKGEEERRNQNKLFFFRKSAILRKRKSGMADFFAEVGRWQGQLELEYNSLAR